jgi:hypothetical protein
MDSPNTARRGDSGNSNQEAPSSSTLNNKGDPGSGPSLKPEHQDGTANSKTSRDDDVDMENDTTSKTEEEENKIVLPWAFIECEIDGLIELVGKSRIVFRFSLQVGIKTHKSD